MDEEMRHREVKQLVHGDTACERQSWELKSVWTIPEFMF